MGKTVQQFAATWARRRLDGEFPSDQSNLAARRQRSQAAHEGPGRRALQPFIFNNHSNAHLLEPLLLIGRSKA